jgi:YHS domain-containing protein
MKLLTKLVFVIMLFSCLAAFAADDQTSDKPNLVRVEAKKVCMINNQVMEKDQIPVDVNGKTYYGCCEMCKKALQEKEEARTAVDPVSGKKVDKAAAIIGADKNGKVFYFESEKNLNSYTAKNE